MILVKTPLNKSFDYFECERLYNFYKESVQGDNFSEIIKNTYFYSFYVEQTEELLGCIYYYKKNRKLFVNAFSNRGHHLLNLECLKESLKWFNCNIYALGLHRTSRICLLKCGFKRIKDNLFIYRRKK